MPRPDVVTSEDPNVIPEEDEDSDNNEIPIDDNNDDDLLQDEEERFYSIVNPAFVEDETNEENEEDGEWGWLHDFFPSDTSSRNASPTPPMPPPRSSSIETPKKEITIVVHLVSSPTKSQQNLNLLGLPSTSSRDDDSETTQSNSSPTNLHFDLIQNRMENGILTTTIHTTTNNNSNNNQEIFPVPDLLCHSTIRNEGYFNNSTSVSSLGTTPPTTNDELRHHEHNVDKSISTTRRQVNVLTSSSDAVVVDINNQERQEELVRDETLNDTHQQIDMLSNQQTSTTLPNDYQQLQTQSDDDDDEEIIDSGFIPRFVRASMRRVRRFRLSTRQNSHRHSSDVEHSVNEDSSTQNNTTTLDTTQTTILQETVIEINNTTNIDDDDLFNHHGNLGSVHNNDDTNTDHDEEDSSEISSTITDRISESAPELPPPRVRHRGTPAPSLVGDNAGNSPRPDPSPLGTWPHDACFALAALGCTAGLFNICRFAVLCLQFGGPFLLQFLLLSILFGIPLFLFHVALGHYLGAGVMDMWRISPVFQGVGIALLAGQALIGLYSIVGVSWLFIYFRDSFVTRSDNYKWSQPFPLYRGGRGLDTIGLSSSNTSKLEETVPDYFSGVVLQRYNLSSPDRSFGHFKFQVAFNLAVVWMIVFVSLSKGLKSYGKVVFVFVSLAVGGLFMLSCQMFRMAAATNQPVFPDTVWTEFITNNQSWIAAATETFFTWGLLGIASLQAASHVAPGSGRRLLRDSMIVVLATLSLLIFVAFLADACNELLRDKGYIYLHNSSFEAEPMSTAQFLRAVEPQRDGEQVSPMPTRLVPHSSMLAGQRLVLPISSRRSRRSLSGYQAIRLATELLPATFAALGISQLSVFWAILAYFSLILFGIAQQLAVWHSVITGIIAINARSLKSWETTITFFTCAFGYILGLPLTTELGIWVVYFLDTVVGSGWWLALLHCLLLVAVLVVRGRPYNGETLAKSLFGTDTEEQSEEQATSRTCCSARRGFKLWFAPLLSFVWSVVLPVSLLILSVVLFRTSESGELYDWSALSDRLYWPVWARELGSILQLLPVLVVPLVAMVQTCRYLANGPPDLFDRIELLYRPAPWGGRPRSSTGDMFASMATDATTGTGGNTDASDDPPPKYTPPPSYTTATGARIAKLLRESIRRSMRRLAAPSTSGTTSQNSSEHLPPPPDYNSVLMELRRTSGEIPRNIMTAQEVAQILRSSFRRTREQNRPVSSELLEIRPSQASQTLPARSKTLTAPEVAQILRSGSLRRSGRRPQRSTTNNDNNQNTAMENNTTTITLNQDSSSSNI